jgi:hypothetical protein
MQRRWLTPLLLAPLALILAASPAAAQPASSVVGAWELQTDHGTIRFVFNPDGTGTLNQRPLQWAFASSVLRLAMYGGQSVAYTAAVTANTLQLAGGDLAQTVTLRRVSSTGAVDAALVGKWRAVNGAVIEFRADGSGQNQRGPFRYTAGEGVLMIVEAGSTLTFEYRLDGDRLTVASLGETATFARAEVGAQVGSPAGRASAGAGPGAARNVVINHVRLPDEQVRRLEQQFQVRIVDGTYWYDRASGAWGVQGGPTAGFIPARLDVGGPLRADASGGGTGVFVNGRELHPLDVAALQQIMVVQRGRFWVDERGNGGYEGNPTPIFNLVMLANQARARSGGSYHHRSGITGIGSGGDGKTSYVMGKDWSVIIGE